MSSSLSENDDDEKKATATTDGVVVTKKSATATTAGVVSSEEMQPPALVQTKSKLPSPLPELTPNEMMRALGTSPRRIALSLISGTGIALAGNLFGITSQLLTLFEEDVVESTGLDTYYPRGNYKRFRTADYTFVLPAVWVADTAVELAKAQRRTSSLDYSMTSSSAAAARRGILPDAGEGVNVGIFLCIMCQQYQDFRTMVFSLSRVVVSYFDF
jgi:hypothetical protein